MKQTTEQLFDSIDHFIAQSRTHLERGNFIELAGLDDQVRTLCDAVLELTQEERLRHADRLQKILSELQSLGEAMVTQRDLVAEEIQGIGSHKKANVAYRVADSRDGFGPKDDDE